MKTEIKIEPNKPNIEALLESGFCTVETGMVDKDFHFIPKDPSPCKTCELNFDYEGQYTTDTPYSACDVIEDILRTIVGKREGSKV